MRNVRMFIIPIIMFIAVFLGGCIITSVHPLYTDEDLVFVPELLGIWRTKGENDTWMFKKAEDKTYKLIVFNEKSSEKFEAHLLQLEDYFFLDILPEKPEDWDGMYPLLMMPTHTFMKVSLEGDVLGLAFLNLEWIKEMLEQKKVDIKHEIRDDDMILLTASTKELKDFVMKYADNEDVFKFDEKDYLYRLKSIE